MPFAEQKVDGSDSESEEDLEPWDQPMDGDEPPAPGAGPEEEFAVEIGEAIVPSPGQRWLRMRHISCHGKAPLHIGDRVLAGMGIF